MKGAPWAAAVFERAVPLDRLPADLRLRSLEWGIFFAVTGRHSVARVGDGLGVSSPERDAAFARLTELGLLAERSLTAGEYLRVAAAGGEAPRPLEAFLTASLEGLLDSPQGSPPRSEVTDDALAPDPSPDDFEPLPIPEPEIAMPQPSVSPVSPKLFAPLSLRAVLRFVVDQARDADAGQLDVYRAFVRLDPNLLKRNGITTLRFEEDRLLTDPDLKKALLESVEQVVGRPCPPEVFVAS